MIIVIDTNILVKGFLDNNLDALMRFFPLFYTKRELHIAIDYEDVILTEYRNNMRNSPLFQKWFTHLQTYNQVQYCSGQLTAKIRDRLTELGFHEATDQTFVAVCLNSGKVIVTEDSDYGKGKEDKAIDKLFVLHYMEKELEMKVFDISEVSDFLS